MEENALSVAQSARNCKRLLERRKSPLLVGERLQVICMDFQLDRVKRIFGEVYTGIDIIVQTASSDSLPPSLQKQFIAREDRLRLADAGGTAPAPDSPEISPILGGMGSLVSEGFDRFGEPIEHNGNCILCHFPVGSGAAKVLSTVQRILQDSDIGQEKYWFPPPSSFHLPIFPLVVEGSRTKDVNYPRHSWKEIHEDVCKRTAGIRRSSKWALFTMAKASLHPDLHTIIFEPTIASLHAIDAYRNAAFEDTKFGNRPSTGGRHKIEMKIAYLTRPGGGLDTPEAGSIRRAMSMALSPLSGSRSGLGSSSHAGSSPEMRMDLDPPMCCSFRDLSAYNPFTAAMLGSFLKPCGCDTRSMLCVHDMHTSRPGGGSYQCPEVNRKKRPGEPGENKAPALSPLVDTTGTGRPVASFTPAAGARSAGSVPKVTIEPACMPPCAPPRSQPDDGELLSAAGGSSSGVLPCGCDPLKMLCVHALMR